MDTPTDRPIPDSYWVEPGRFLAGEYPGRFDAEQTRRRMAALLAAGFDTFIDLTAPGELPAYLPALLEEARRYEREISHKRYPITDFGLPTTETMRAILDEIDRALAEGRQVYLHCWGGVGRTGTTVGCYLVRRGLSGEAALRRLAEWWQNVPKSLYHPRSPETREQREFVLNWDERRP